jgi:hypothetical protein
LFFQIAEDLFGLKHEEKNGHVVHLKALLERVVGKKRQAANQIKNQDNMQVIDVDIITSFSSH